MSDTTKILQQAHAELWAFRDEMADYWPTPDTLDALRFAVTEAGEALDAWMRANRPQYARNRERLDYGAAVLDELADCAMMLLTAVPIGIDMSTYPATYFEWKIDKLIIEVSEIFRRFVHSDVYPYPPKNLYGDIMWWINVLSFYPGMDLLPRLQSRYARIRAKNKPNPVQAAYAANHAAYGAQLIHYGAQNASAEKAQAKLEAQTYGVDTL